MESSQGSVREAGWFFMIFHGSRSVFMVFHGSRSVFIVFHGSQVGFSLLQVGFSLSQVGFHGVLWFLVGF